MTTTQQIMQAKLSKAGIPAKEIKCYGSQIMITAWSHEAALKWAALLGNFAKVRGVVESRDYNKVNKNTCLKPSTHKVWLVGAVI